MWENCLFRSELFLGIGEIELWWKNSLFIDGLLLERRDC